jgi:ABC-type lipoprotein release transport system permease subunit
MMSLAFTIAWRNLWRHRGKSIVIGVILFLGALLMTVGNGLISGMEKGLAENIVNSFTGDIVVISNEQENDNVLFDVMGGKPLKVIKNFDAAQKILAKETGIQRFLPAAAGPVFVLNPGSDMSNVMLLGVDIAKYRQMFPHSIRITEGGMLQPGERGVLISEEARKQIYDFMNFWATPAGTAVNRKKMPADIRAVKDLDIHSDMVFMGTSTSNSTMDVRVPIKGIIRFKALNKIWGDYCIVDIESFREAHNYVTGAESKVKIPQAEQKLLADDNLDQIFASGNILAPNEVTAEDLSLKEVQSQTRRQAARYNPDAGSFNLAFVKLKPGISQTAALNKLNLEFRREHVNVRAVSWKNAVGVIGSMAVMVKTALNTFIMFIFFVAMIVIMNTLSMAAIERVSEIGMMRAIGARKGFLGKMFINETGILSFCFGGLGMITGIVVIYLLKAVGISTTNEILQLVYGGEQLSPIFTLADGFIGVVELGIVTFLSVLYPLRVVGKITPLDAIARD